MSTTSIRYGERGELVEPDNWWHEDSYFNIRMEEFLQSVTDATENGYTVCICGDVSEPGYDKYKEVGIIPSFDIPSEHISEDARELRLYNNSTTDDHCIHIVGHYKENDESWFMIKDSGSGGFDGPNKGYRFIHEDYIRLKMMNIMIHKEGAPILDRLIK
jgi:bleomycin hydrolase